MKKKTLKLLAVLLVICLAVTALAVFADSADCYLNKSQYYAKSSYAYGNYATGFLETYSDSAYSVMGKIYGDGAGFVSRTLLASPDNEDTSRGNPVSGFSAWYIYLQPVTSGGSGLGGHAHGRVDTTLTAR